ncbi:MAG: hypothetical protein ACE5G0_02895 [Rhodothermales bacterium]
MQWLFWIPLISMMLIVVGLPRVAMAQGAPPNTDTLMTLEQWANFDNNLASALTSNNDGVKEGALRQIIRHGEYLDMSRLSAFDVMRIYRNHKDDDMRHLAVLALGNMNDRWAIEFLDMLSGFETSEKIQKTMDDVVKAYWAKHGGNPYQ